MEDSSSGNMSANSWYACKWFLNTCTIPEPDLFGQTRPEPDLKSKRLTRHSLVLIQNVNPNVHPVWTSQHMVGSKKIFFVLSVQILNMCILEKKAYKFKHITFSVDSSNYWYWYWKLLLTRWKLVEVDNQAGADMLADRVDRRLPDPLQVLVYRYRGWGSGCQFINLCSAV